MCIPIGLNRLAMWNMSRGLTHAYLQEVLPTSLHNGISRVGNYSTNSQLTEKLCEHRLG